MIRVLVNHDVEVVDGAIEEGLLLVAVPVEEAGVIPLAVSRQPVTIL